MNNYVPKNATFHIQKRCTQSKKHNLKMAYLIGQELVFTSPNGKREKVTIIKRAIDYKNGVINEPNYKGNFDYYVSIERNHILENIFCQEDDLS